MNEKNGVTTVRLGERDLRVTLPGFAEREDLVQAWASCADRSPGGEVDVLRMRRVASAALGLCTPLGREARLDYARCNYDVLGYGGRVYAVLAERGVGIADVIRAGATVIDLAVAGLYPRAPEVAARASFSEGGEPPTS